MHPRRRLGGGRLVPRIPTGLAHRFLSPPRRPTRPHRAAERWCFVGARVSPSPCEWASLCFYASHKDNFHLFLYLNLFDYFLFFNVFCLVGFAVGFFCLFRISVFCPWHIACTRSCAPVKSSKSLFCCVGKGMFKWFLPSVSRRVVVFILGALPRSEYSCLPKSEVNIQVLCTGRGLQMLLSDLCMFLLPKIYKYFIAVQVEQWFWNFHYLVSLQYLVYYKIYKRQCEAC